MMPPLTAKAFAIKVQALRRFFAKVVFVRSGCWEWNGALNSSGYGSFAADCAHRVSYAWFKGDLSNDCQIDHLCRNKRCVNPSHLEAVSRAVNVQRAMAVRTSCRNGHPRDEANLRMWKTGRGTVGRYCHACRLASRARGAERERIAEAMSVVERIA